MAGADDVPFEVADSIGGEVTVTEDMETTALVTGLDGAYCVVGTLELAGDSEGTLLEPLDEATVGKAPVAESLMTEWGLNLRVIEPALYRPAWSAQWPQYHVLVTVSDSAHRSSTVTVCC
jgi:hypothetical protein